MALYLGSEKININLNGILYKLNLYSESPIANNVSMLSTEEQSLENPDLHSISTKKEDE